VEIGDGLYVRQTRHALGTRLRLTLQAIAAGDDDRSVGTFAYYPDFRGFQTTPVGNPLVAHVRLDAGLFTGIENLAIASRAGGYTPIAHSLCRLVQYNVMLGAGLGIAAALATGSLADVSESAIRDEMIRQGILCDDRQGFDWNRKAQGILASDRLCSQEAAIA